VFDYFDAEPAGLSAALRHFKGKTRGASSFLYKAVVIHLLHLQMCMNCLKILPEYNLHRPQQTEGMREDFFREGGLLILPHDIETLR